MKKVLNREDCFLLGHIRKAQGIHGAVKIQQSADHDLAFDALQFLFLDLPDGLIPFHIDTLHELSGLALEVKFTDIPDVEATRKLQNAAVYLPLALMPEAAAPSAEDAWLGFAMSDKLLGEVGKVSGFIHFNEQSLIRVDKDGQEMLIPLVPEIILNVNMKKRLISVDLPEGLAELNA